MDPTLLSPATMSLGAFFFHRQHSFCLYRPHLLILHSFATDACVEVLFPVEVWQHLSRIPWRRLQFRLPPGSTYSFGAIRPVGHVSVIGKVLPMTGVSAREEAFMELIIRLIDFDIRPATIASVPAASLQQARRSSSFSSQLLPNHCSFHLSSYSLHASTLNLIHWHQVSIRDGSLANMEQLHDGLGLGDRRMSVEVSRAVEVVHAEEGIAVRGMGGGEEEGQEEEDEEVQEEEEKVKEEEEVVLEEEEEVQEQEEVVVLEEVEGEEGEEVLQDEVEEELHDAGATTAVFSQ
jgi:hypothetical protein